MQASSTKTTTQQHLPGMAETRYRLPTLAGHSGRLKYADPRDLPSYPSPGLKSDGAAAGAAASLGWANQKSIDLWKSEKPNSASAAAAVHAKDYKMATTREPNSSSAGARAALLATSSARKQATTAPTARTTHESWGNSAATQAFKQSLSVRQPTHATSTDSLSSLSAAQNAMLAPTRTRPRAQSTPVPKESYPGESRAAASALRAATAAHSPSLKPRSSADASGSVPYTNLPRKMFTAAPSIGPEADDQRRADVLHASAVAMAKKMYSQQQKMADQTRQAHQALGEPSLADSQPKPYVNLQEAAYKLAQERLSKLHEEHQRNQEYQEYYGNGVSGHAQRRFTVKGKLRRRSSSDGDINHDREQSERIRRQMSIFSANLSKVDEQKRARDREALLAVAQRNVKARLQGMDDKISAETGMVPPTTNMSDWGFKAHLAAQTRHKALLVHKDKVDIGGGLYMDPAEVDEIAASRVQPVLDEINEKAAAERERQELLRAETEAKKRDEEKRKERDREIKEINRKIREADKQEEKERRLREKQAQRAKKEEDKSTRADKRHSSSEKRKSKYPGTLPDDSAVTGETSTQEVTEEESKAPTVSRRASQHKPTINTQKEIPAGTTGADNPRSPSESGSPTSKMKEWLKSRFSRPRGRSSAGEGSTEEKGFIGGVALTRLANESATSLDARSTSMRELATAGKRSDKFVPETTRGHEDFSGRPRDSKDISPVSTDDESNRFVEARDDLEEPISPPEPIKDPSAYKSSSPTRDSRFREIIE